MVNKMLLLFFQVYVGSNMESPQTAYRWLTVGGCKKTPSDTILIQRKCMFLCLVRISVASSSLYDIL